LTLKKETENKAKKPLKFTPDSLQKVIDKYFKDTPFEEYTITGLALKIGSKQLIQNYEKRENFTEIIHIAKLMVEHSYEMSLRKNGNAGNIFALKNFGWKDEKQLGVSGGLEIITGITINLVKPK